MFAIDEIKEKVIEIKKNNNLSGISNKDMLLYLIHRIDEIQGCINNNEKEIISNTVNIGWLKKAVVGVFGAIGLLLLYLII